MNRFLKYFTCYIVCLIVLYIIIAFSTLTTNPVKWLGVNRGMWLFFPLLTTFIYAIKKDLDE